MKGIVEIIGDVVKEMSGNLTIVMPADIENDRFEEVKNPACRTVLSCYREERQSGLLFKGFTEYPYSVFINEELEQ